jgi:DNA-binding response OmpR family regulator
MIVLPEAADLSAASPASPASPDEPQPTVVLGSASVTRLQELARGLRAEGFAVLPAGSGLEALSVFLDRTGQIDAFVLDINLPDLPGADFLRRLRAHFPGVPCVFLASGQQIQGTAAGVLSSGVTMVSQNATGYEIAERVRRAVAEVAAEG